MEGKNRFLALTISLILISGAISPAFVSPAFANGETLYMVSKGANTASSSQLWTLDKTTGIATPLANTVGFIACTSMDFVSGTLYAACETSIQLNSLILIDHFSGIGTNIGPNGGGSNYGGMATDDTSGILYAYQSGPGTALSLGTMSIGSGAFTDIVGPSGVGNYSSIEIFGIVSSDSFTFSNCYF